MVASPGECPWFSFRGNAMGKSIQLLTPHPSYLALGETEAQRRIRYQGLFKQAIPSDDIADIRECTSKAWVLDSILVRLGVLERILRRLIQDLESRGKIDLSEVFIDVSFASAKKGALELAKLSAEKGPRSWQSRTAMVFLSEYPLAVLHRMKSRS